MQAQWKIVHFRQPDHGPQVIDLWREVFSYDSPHNDPALALDKKTALDDGLLFVAEMDSGEVVGTIMAGYDGHRGWLYSLAVHPEHRLLGIGSALVRHAEGALTERGCVKINLQILNSNREAEHFYRKFGFETEERINMGKKVRGNIP